ncbi:uncharacterized protein V1518DRAFT_419653 [Limtongia smithiae]|uniref:uncharacterized protein n=1 Tax=Limtongia smithiae TaxID=1125753 RepID=UPI0034CF2021
MSTLFQAITRPADDFLEVRKRGTIHSHHTVSLVDHTVQEDSDADDDDTTNDATLTITATTEGTTAGEGRSSADINGTDNAASHDDDSNSSEDEDDAETSPLIARHISADIGSPRQRRPYARPAAQVRSCMSFEHMIKSFLSVVCCCFVSGVDEEDEYILDEDGGILSIIPSRFTRRGYERLRERENQSQKAAENGVLSNDPNIAYDVLYENQRGFFILGTPFFSSQSLLNFDPSSWVDSDYNFSPVDILSAPVPDPSWEWVWRTWYIDMTYDVDDQGWSYALLFSASKWHGAHVWFSSFVRRRRWIRKRRRLPTVEAEYLERLLPNGRNGGLDGLNRTRNTKRVTSVVEGNSPEYFTVRSTAFKKGKGTKRQAASEHQQAAVPKLLPVSSYGATTGGDSVSAHPESRRSGQDYEFTFSDDDYDFDDDESVKISTIGTLMRKLKKARLDRQKIDAVERFVGDGGDDIVLLSTLMGQIISFLVFQESRRELLRCLLHYYKQIRNHSMHSERVESKQSLQDLNRHRGHAHDHAGHVQINLGDMSAKELFVRRRALHRAILVASREVSKLDFYSDRKLSSKEYAKLDLLLVQDGENQSTFQLQKQPQSSLLPQPPIDTITEECLEEVENDDDISDLLNADQTPTEYAPENPAQDATVLKAIRDTTNLVDSSYNVVEDSKLANMHHRAMPETNVIDDETRKRQETEALISGVQSKVLQFIAQPSNRQEN